MTYRSDTAAAREIARHYMFQRRVRPIDWGHLGECQLPRARSWGMAQTPAAEALATARYRIAARDTLARHPDVASAYDWTTGELR